MLLRLAGVLVAVVLATSTVQADPLPFEIVRMLPETSQVLVFDRVHNTHVLLQPGAKFDDYTVIEIRGIDMVVEKAQERFVVYPREAKYLALTVLPRAQNAAPLPPVIYGRSAPAPAPAQVADGNAVDAKKTVDTKRATESKAQVAQGLALVLAETPKQAAPRTRAPSLTTTLATSKMKP
jgi:hypothetical protein